MGDYEANVGLTGDGVRAYAAAVDTYNSYLEGLLGTTVMVEGAREDAPLVPVLITAENVGGYAMSFEEQSGLTPELISAYESFVVLNETREGDLTDGAIDALNYMLDLDAPASS